MLQANFILARLTAGQGSCFSEPVHILHKHRTSSNKSFQTFGKDASCLVDVGGSMELLIGKVEADSASLHRSGAKRTIFTFFGDGLIIELPTRWLRAIFFEPRYSPFTVNQYAHNLKDLLSWLAEAQCYETLSIDTA